MSEQRKHELRSKAGRAVKPYAVLGLVFCALGVVNIVTETSKYSSGYLALGCLWFAMAFRQYRYSKAQPIVPVDVGIVALLLAIGITYLILGVTIYAIGFFLLAAVAVPYLAWIRRRF
jgi:hypothetical protein